MSSKIKTKFVALIALVTVGLSVIIVAYLTVAARYDTVADSEAAGPTSQRGVVDFVVDGDTLDLTIDGASERVRLIGIDTPETVNPQTPIQCFGDEASTALRELLPEGSEVRIERDVEARDRFNRLLLYVYRSDDDLFVNQWMVENGFASAISYRPNVAYENTFSQSESEAKSSNIGLWAVCDGPDQPLDPKTP